MAFLSGLFSRPAPAAAAPAPVQFQIPAAMPKLATGSPTEVAARAGLSNAAGVPTATAVTSKPAYLTALLQQQKPVEAVSFLAYALPERDAVKWAAQSCELVAAKQTPVDKRASEAAQRWIAQPTAANQQAAGASAAEAGHAGPGAWAAQAAAWATPAAGAAPGAPSVAPDLLGKAVAGSVMLAAALAKPNFILPVPGIYPAVSGNIPDITQSGTVVPPTTETNRELCLLYKPFIDRGIALAAT